MIAGLVKANVNSQDLLANMLGGLFHYTQQGDFSLNASHLYQSPSILIAIDGEITNIDYLKQLTNESSIGSILSTLYWKFSHSFVEHIEGCFVIALYDILGKELFLFRDRLGEKLVYWSLTENTFLFASSLSSLLKSNLIEERVNFEALSSLLFFGYIPQEKSPIQKVYRLLPGHYLHYSAMHAIEIRPYDSLATKLEALKPLDIKNPTFEKQASLTLFASRQDLAELISILGEPIGNPFALYAFLQLKGGKNFDFLTPERASFQHKIASFSKGFSYSPKFFKLQEHPYVAKLLGYFHPKSLFKILRASYIHPYHHLFLRKASLFNNNRLEELVSAYFEPLDIELFLHRFPSLETLGPTKTSLIYLLLKTEIPSLYFFTETRLKEHFGLNQESKGLLPFITPILEKETALEFQLSKPLMDDLLTLLEESELIRTLGFRKNWISSMREHKALSAKSQMMILTLASIELWIQIFVEKQIPAYN